MLSLTRIISKYFHISEESESLENILSSLFYYYSYFRAHCLSASRLLVTSRLSLCNNTLSSLSVKRSMFTIMKKVPRLSENEIFRNMIYQKVILIFVPLMSAKIRVTFIVYIVMKGRLITNCDPLFYHVSSNFQLH